MQHLHQNATHISIDLPKKHSDAITETEIEFRQK